MSPRLSDGDTEAHLRARITVLERERADAVARAERVESLNVDLRRDLLEDRTAIAELRADLQMWILRYRLRWFTIQLPPEAPFIPSQRAAPEQRRPLRRTQRPDEVRERRAFHGGAR